MITLTEPLFLIFIAVATGISYWSGKKQGQNELITVLLEKGIIEKDD